MKYRVKISILCKVAFIITIVLELNSCSLPTTPQFMYSPPDEKEQVEQQEKLVLDAINTRDVSAIKDLFSKNALAQIDNIDGKLKEFLDFYSGNYVSCRYGSSIGDKFGNGNHKKSFYLGMVITTDKDSYTVTCTDVISSPKNQDDVGICRIAIIHEADANSSSAWHKSSGDVPEVECFYK